MDLTLCTCRGTFIAHLQCLVKPPIATVPLAASSMEHLDSSTTAVQLISNLRHCSIQAHSKNASLNSRH